MIRVETQVSHSSRVAHTFWLFYKGHGNAEIPNLLNVLHICLKISLPLIRDRIGRAREVYSGCWVSERFNTVFWGRKGIPVKVLRVSGCSWRTRAQGGPSHAMERLGARGSNRRTLLGHRRGSGAWTAWQWTRAGSCGTTGCPGQEPSRQDELRLSLGLKGGWKINAPYSQVWKLYMTPHPVCLSL